MSRYYIYDSVTDTYAEFAKPKSDYKRPVGRPKKVTETSLATVSNNPRPRRMKLTHQVAEVINNPVLTAPGKQSAYTPAYLAGRKIRQSVIDSKRTLTKGVSKVIKSKPAIALASVGAVALGGVGVSKLSKLIKDKTKKGKVKDNSNNQVTK